MSLRLLSIALFAVGLWEPAIAAPLSDQEIRQLIIQDSVRGYPGNCPCPWNTDRAGRRCGARSAYSRPGGLSPKCYASDVSDRDVSAYRESRGIADSI